MPLNQILDLKFSLKKRDKLRPKRGTLSIAKAKSLLNYKPKYNLEKGTKKYIEFVKLLKLENLKPPTRN